MVIVFMVVNAYSGDYGLSQGVVRFFVRQGGVSE